MLKPCFSKEARKDRNKHCGGHASRIVCYAVYAYQIRIDCFQIAENSTSTTTLFDGQQRNLLCNRSNSIEISSLSIQEKALHTDTFSINHSCFSVSCSHLTPKASVIIGALPLSR